MLERRVFTASKNLTYSMHAARQQPHPLVSKPSTPQQQLMRHTNWSMKQTKAWTTKRIIQTSTASIPTDDAISRDPTMVYRRAEGAFGLSITSACLGATDGDSTLRQSCIYPSVSSAHVVKSMMKPITSCTPPTPSLSNIPKPS